MNAARTARRDRLPGRAGPALLRHVRGWARPGVGRIDVVQSLKAAAAAALAWAVTGWWLHAPMALMAPWAAVALVQSTVYRSLRSGLQQVLMIALGTLVAAGAAVVTGNTMAAMVVALPVVVLLGNCAPVGEQGLYAPTTALFVLAYGSYSAFDVAHRLVETCIGAVIGIGVNAVVLPPVLSRDVKRLSRRLPGDCAELLSTVADELEADYGRERAESWYTRAEGLRATLSELRTARQWATESYRFNPGHRLRASALAPPPEWDLVWERIGEHLQTITRTLLEAAVDRGRLATPPPSALECAAEVLRAAGDVCAMDQKILEDGPDEERRERRAEELDRAWRAHSRLKRELPDGDTETATSVGGLVAEIQRLLHDLAP
ncbi:FUSC family protein [Streptomyces sp. DT24]|uniref:FUSC family protein n=1 Tax=unclassified Streptomyces TaxID=2593676 RepID=UPI003CE9F3AA